MINIRTLKTNSIQWFNDPEFSNKVFCTLNPMIRNRCYCFTKIDTTFFFFALLVVCYSRFSAFLLNTTDIKIWKKANEKLFKLLIQPYERSGNLFPCYSFSAWFLIYQTETYHHKSLLIFYILNQFYIKIIDLLCN